MTIYFKNSNGCINNIRLGMFLSNLLFIRVWGCEQVFSWQFFRIFWKLVLPIRLSTN